MTSPKAFISVFNIEKNNKFEFYVRKADGSRSQNDTINNNEADTLSRKILSDEYAKGI